MLISLQDPCREGISSHHPEICWTGTSRASAELHHLFLWLSEAIWECLALNTADSWCQHPTDSDRRVVLMLLPISWHPIPGTQILQHVLLEQGPYYQANEFIHNGREPVLFHSSQASSSIFTKLPQSTATIRWVRTSKTDFNNLVFTGQDTSKAGWLMPKHRTFGIYTTDMPHILTLYRSALWNTKSKNHILFLQRREDHRTCSQKVLLNKTHLSL